VWKKEKGKKEEKENVERKKTGSIERIVENYEKRERRENIMEISTSERKMVRGKNVEKIDSSMGEI